MDASIMDGKTLSAGACAIVKTVKNPIKLANVIREKSFHVLLAGDGAGDFATSQGIKKTPPEDLISEYSKQVLEVFKKSGGKIEVKIYIFKGFSSKLSDFSTGRWAAPSAAWPWMLGGTWRRAPPPAARTGS